MLSPSSEKSVFIKRLPPSSKQGSPGPGLADRTRSGSNTSTISRSSLYSIKLFYHYVNLLVQRSQRPKRELEARDSFKLKIYK